MKILMQQQLCGGKLNEGVVFRAAAASVHPCSANHFIHCLHNFIQFSQAQRYFFCNAWQLFRIRLKIKN